MTQTSNSLIGDKIDDALHRASMNINDFCEEIESLVEMHQPGGEPLFRPSERTLTRLRRFRELINSSISMVENIT